MSRMFLDAVETDSRHDLTWSLVQTSQLKKSTYMKKTLIALAVLAVFSCNSEASLFKTTGKEAPRLISANQWWPGSAWDNVYSQWHEGSVGKVNAIQPNGNVDLILSIACDGLLPDQEYQVWIDTNGVNNSPSSHGPFLLGTWVAKLHSDEFGSGELNLTFEAGSLSVGVYAWSVYLVLPNIPGVGSRTVLISQNIPIIIE
jgi:hypothetical protein